MLQEIRRVRENEKGFTLIELLIVVVILGVLAGIVVFAVSNFNGQGVAAACKSDVKNVEIASEAYYAQKGAVSPDVATLQTTNYLKDPPPVFVAAGGGAPAVNIPGAKYGINYTAGATGATVTGNLTTAGGGVAAPC